MRGIVPVPIPRFLAVLFDARTYLVAGLACTAAALAVLGLLQVAWGAGSTVPQRHATLCETFGCTEPCRLVSRRSVQGRLTFLIGDEIGEPDASRAMPGVRASAIMLESAGRRVADVIQVNDAEYGLHLPPCLFPECVERRERDASYGGLTREQLGDVAGLTNHLLLQRAGTSLAEGIRQMFDARGEPVVVRARPAALNLESDRSRAASFVAEVVIDFVTGCR